MPAKIVKEKQRGCGWRKPGGVYVRAENWVDLEMEAGYESGPFRGIRLVDVEALLAGKPMAEWWIGVSKKTERQKAIEELEAEVWGMPIRVRLKIGECTGMDEETAKRWAVNLKSNVNINPTVALQVLADIPAARPFAEAFVSAWPSLPLASLAAAWRAAWAGHGMHKPKLKKATIMAAAVLTAAAGATKDAEAILGWLNGQDDARAQ